MSLAYQSVEILHKNKTYYGTVSDQKPAFVPGEDNTRNRYLFLINNWDGDGPGILVISKKGDKWEPEDSGSIVDKELAKSAGEALEKLFNIR